MLDNQDRLRVVITVPVDIGKVVTQNISHAHFDAKPFLVLPWMEVLLWMKLRLKKVLFGYYGLSRDNGLFLHCIANSS
jgi:hypothetical protein